MGDQDVRASDAEREQVADALRRAAGDGRLASDELEERLTAAYGARTRGELGPLTADLPAPPAAPGSGRPPVRPASWTAGLSERLGAWLIPNLICVGIWLASGAHGSSGPSGSSCSRPSRSSGRSWGARGPGPGTASVTATTATAHRPDRPHRPRRPHRLRSPRLDKIHTSLDARC